MAERVANRVAAWQAAWVAAMPRRSRVTAKEWEKAIVTFLDRIRNEETKAPLGFWGRLQVLYRFQRWLAATFGVEKERLRPLVVAIILNYLFAR